MRQKLITSVVGLWCLASPALAQMGSGNVAPTITSLAVSPSPAPANAAATIQCSASDSDGQIRSIVIAVSAGLLPNGTASQAAPITAASQATGTLTWSTPGDGVHSVTCTAYDSGGIFGGSARAVSTIQVTVSAPASLPPVITGFTVSSTRVAPGARVALAAAAEDPDGDPLSFAWSASGGQIDGGPNGATWIAPEAPGVYVVRVSVSDPFQQTVTVEERIAVSTHVEQGALAPHLLAPRRAAATPTGELFVVDAGADRLWLLTRRGDVKGAIALPGAPTAVASCGAFVVVATREGRLWKLDPEQGRRTGEVQLANGPLVGAAGLACDPSTRTVYVAERLLDRVRAVQADGADQFVVSEVNGAALRAPADVAFDAATKRIWVAQGAGDTGMLAHAFDATDGAFVRSIAPYGAGPGKLTRAAGVTVSPAGHVYLADVFQGAVKMFSAAGPELGEIGAFGASPGSLRQPTGLTWMANHDLVVASLDTGTLERFGDGSPLPECDGDRDCDGLPDAWELAFGLNADDARDALSDGDADGLSALDELRHGSDPTRSDSDGDGYADGDEVNGGFDPADPLDHAPQLYAAAAVVSDPGLVRMAAVLKGAAACTVLWAQSSGPEPVVLRGATTTTPSFIGRVAGDYEFVGVARCGELTSAPATLLARVRNAAPIPNVAHFAAVAPGAPIFLEGLFSSDPNGDALTYEWDQLLGKPVTSTTAVDSLEVSSPVSGLLTFRLTVKDPAGQEATRDVDVVVVSPQHQAPTAMVNTPVFGRARARVVLDASASVGAEPFRATYSWQQVSGPATALRDADSATPWFIPPAAGRYEFDVTMKANRLFSAPARVTVFVAADGRPLPVAVAPPQTSASVGEPVALDGSASTGSGAGGPKRFAWRQRSGPAIGLTDADRPIATVVPFAPGTVILELVVFDGEAESAPAFVRIDAAAPDAAQPVAVARGATVAIVEQDLTLDGSRSSDADGQRLTFRWKQVAGPWVALEAADSARPHFTPKVPGVYSFELVVDDGAIQSAPDTVSVLVFPATGGTGR